MNNPTIAGIVVTKYPPSKFGLSGFMRLRRLSWFSDGGNAIIETYLDTNGAVGTYDVIVRGSSTASLAAATSVSTWTIDLNIPYYTLLLDSACDKFYWKRTA